MSVTVHVTSVSERRDGFDVSFQVLDGDTVVATHVQGFPLVRRLRVVPGTDVIFDPNEPRPEWAPPGPDGWHREVEVERSEELEGWEWTPRAVVEEALLNYARTVVARKNAGPLPVEAENVFEV